MAEVESNLQTISYKINEESFKQVFKVDKFLETAGTQNVTKSEEFLLCSGNLKVQMGVMCLNKNKKTANINVLLYGRATKRQISVVGVKFAVYNPYAQNIDDESTYTSTWKTLDNNKLEFQIISEYQTQYKYCRGYYSDNFERGYGYIGEGNRHTSNNPFDRKSLSVTVRGILLVPMFSIEIESVISSNPEKNDETSQPVYDLSTLLENPKYSDIEISVGSKNIPVHKNILWSRSEGFAKMFEENESNNWSAPLNCIAINGFKEDVVHEALRFLYSGRSLKLKTMVFDLLAFAEKYRIKDLKILCESEIKCSVNVENVCDFLDLADKHNAESLKSYCVQLIKGSIKAVIATEKWKQYRKINPELTGDIMESFFVE